MRCVDIPIGAFVSRGAAKAAFLSLVVLSGNGVADTLRVSAWSLDRIPGKTMEDAGSTNTESQIQEAAQALKRLNPDVILLQEVRDWQMCSQLVQALKPTDYGVQVCSSFRAAPGGSSNQPQVAILSKRKAFMSWSQAWRPESQAAVAGGYAFAVIQVGRHRIGFFSLGLSSETAPGTNAAGASVRAIAPARRAQQWLQAVAGFRNWITNRIEGMVATGALQPGQMDRESLRSLEEAGFSNPFLGPGLDLSAMGPISAALDLDRNSPPGLILDHWPATCDLELDNVHPEVAVVKAVTRGRLLPPEPEPVAKNSGFSTTTGSPQTSSVQTSAPAAALPVQVAQAPSARNGFWWLAVVLIAVAGLGTIIWIFSRRRLTVWQTKPALLPVSVDGSGAAAAYTVVVTPHAVLGSGSTDSVVSSTSRPIVQVEALTPARIQKPWEAWQRRAWAAEQEAQHAAALMRKGLLPHLSHWLKEKLVRRLLADRARLLDMHQAATLKTLAVDERLARVEVQIQQQNKAYERRIAELTRELNTAKEENRELIRAQIIQVRAEMEAARARLKAQAEEEL